MQIENALEKNLTITVVHPNLKTKKLFPPTKKTKQQRVSKFTWRSSTLVSRTALLPAASVFSARAWINSRWTSSSEFSKACLCKKVTTAQSHHTNSQKKKNAITMGKEPNINFTHILCYINYLEEAKDQPFLATLHCHQNNLVSVVSVWLQALQWSHFSFDFVAVAAPCEKKKAKPMFCFCLQNTLISI